MQTWQPGRVQKQLIRMAKKEGHPVIFPFTSIYISIIYD